MKPRLRKLSLTAHITSSVGWLGAVAAFLVLSVAGLVSTDPETVKAAFMSMDLVGRALIVPMSLAASATGLILAVGTPWGLIRYNWVVAKLLLTVVAVVGLLLHQYTAVSAAAALASGSPADSLPFARLHQLGTQLLADSSLAVVLLVAATALSVFKPWGLTAHGQRVAASIGGTARAGVKPQDSRSLRWLLLTVLVLLGLFALLHLIGGGMGH